MEPRSTKSWNQPRVRRISRAGDKELRSCGVDPASLKIFAPKMKQVFLLIEGVKLYAANIIKQTMLSLGGDAAVHRDVITGKVEFSNCLLMGDERHFHMLTDKLQHQPGLRELTREIECQLAGPPPGLTIEACGKAYSWQQLPVIMGILNLTTDSFSDGGSWSDPATALEHARQMVAEGAEIIDVGGESTRPGAEPVSAEEELKRVLPVIKALASEFDTPISIDTQKAAVARAAIDAGAVIINDVSALESDPAMLTVARESGAGLILMHMRGTPQTMQQQTDYDDVVQEVYRYLEERVNFCLASGIRPESLMIDPGIGFGKDLEGNLSLLRQLADFNSIGVPILLGHSRKRFIGQLTDTEVDERETGTDAVTAWAALEKIQLVRVHNVRHAQQIRSVLRAIQP